MTEQKNLDVVSVSEWSQHMSMKFPWKDVVILYPQEKWVKTGIDVGSIC